MNVSSHTAASLASTLNERAERSNRFRWSWSPDTFQWDWMDHHEVPLESHRSNDGTERR
jgi:hypothetical protein